MLLNRLALQSMVTAHASQVWVGRPSPEVEYGGVEGGIMHASLPEVYLARHGETAWTITGQHTGRTDIPLTTRGEQNALSLRQRLNGITFAKVAEERYHP